MDGVVQCPVCTLFLHPGMNLDEHLNTHPKDQVIQALTQLTLQRANILSSSASQFVVKAPVTPPPPAPQAAKAIQQAIPGTSVFTHQKQAIIPQSQNALEPPPPTAVVIQMQPQQPATAQQSPQQLLNKQSSISYVHETQKNVMIVNSCSTQFIQQRMLPENKALSMQSQVQQQQQQQQMKIPYGEPPIQVRRANAITTFCFRSIKILTRKEVILKGLWKILFFL